MMLSRGLLKIELRLGLGLRKGSKTFVGYTHVIEQLSFSMLLSIPTFDIDLIWGPFFLLGALMGYFWGWGEV